MTTRSHWTGILLGCVILGWFTYLTYQRNEVWRDPVRLWADTVSKSPDKARPMLNLGKAYLDSGDIDNAFFRFIEAEELALREGFTPDIETASTARTNRGVILMRRGQLVEASAVLLSVLEDFQPENPLALSALVAVYLDAGLPEDALILSDQLMQRHGKWMETSAAAHVHRARTLAALDYCELAEAHFRAARAIDPSLPLFTCN